MVRRFQILAVASLVFLSAGIMTNGQQQALNPSQVRIQKEVRHELLMLPYFGVFDNIEYQVSDEVVTLLGSVTRPTLKSDAENVVKRIEGVSRVENKIDVLPPSPMDDQLRIALFRAIYGFPSLEKYSLGVQKPIRIIVKSGHVDLEGVVDTEADKTRPVCARKEFLTHFQLQTIFMLFQTNLGGGAGMLRRGGIPAGSYAKGAPMGTLRAGLQWRRTSKEFMRNGWPGIGEY